MSDLPPGWEWTTVGEAGRVELGMARSPARHEGPNMKPYLRVANVFEDRIDLNDVKTMHFAPNEFDRYSLTRGDVLLNEGQSPELLGRPAIYTGEPGRYAFTNSLLRFQGHRGVLPEWALTVFRHYLHSGRFVQEVRITTNIAHLSAGRFKSIEFPLPPLAEQRHIVGLLDAHLESIARGEELVWRCRARGIAMREKIVVGVLHAHGKPHASAPPPLPSFTTDGDLPALPESWSWKRLQDVADVVGGVTKDSSKQSDPNIPLVPYLRVANVQRGRLDLSAVAEIRATPRQVEKLRLLPGDVLLNEGGDRDKLGRGWFWEGQIADCIHQNHVFRARVRNDALHPKLLAWHANSFGHWFEQNGKQSVNLASISLTTIKQLPVPVPPREVQDQLVATIEDQLTVAARLDSQLADASVGSRQLRSALLTDALSGRLMTQEPEDETASVLLDRIRSERKAAEADDRRNSSRRRR